jgi:uncharacterized protein (UPF0332 family)
LEKKYLDEWKRALEFLEAVKNNLKVNDFKTAANRGYFAMERAVVCCLIIEFNKSLKHHQKIWELSKDLDFDVYDLLRELYDLRLQADYGKISDIVELNERVVRDYLNRIETLLNKIKGRYKL